MKNLIYVLSLLSMTAYGFEHSRLDLADPKNDKERQRWLAAMPELTPQNLRFLLPADRWEHKGIFLSEGPHLSVSLNNGKDKDNLNAYEGDLDFYDNPDLKGEPTVKMRDFEIIKEGKTICTYASMLPKVYGQEFLSCKENNCWPKQTQTPLVLDNYKYLADDFAVVESLKVNLPVICPERIDNYKLSVDWADDSYNLKLLSLPKPNSIYAEVMISGNKKFLDVRFCLKQPESCRFRTKKNSLFVDAWFGLMSAKENKDYYNLNQLIMRLKPCVLRNDRECVKYFFPPRANQISDQEMADLKICLDYDKLLPYGGRARAGGDRICIFGDHENIEAITLPDAFDGQKELKVRY